MCPATSRKIVGSPSNRYLSKQVVTTRPERRVKVAGSRHRSTTRRAGDRPHFGAHREPRRSPYRHTGVRCLALFLVLSAFLGTGCGDDGDSDVAVEGSSERTQTTGTHSPADLSIVRQRPGHGAYAMPENRLKELLPNVQYRFDPDSAPTPVSDLAITGQVVEVERGNGFIHGANPGTSRQVDFDHPDLDWAFLTLTVNVDEVLAVADTAESWGPASTVKVGVPVFPQFDDVEQLSGAYASITHGLFVLDTRNDPFGQDDIFPVIGRLGSLLGVIGQDGTIDLPMVEEEQADQLTRGTPTIDSVRKAASEPKRTHEPDDGAT